ncbi:MAG: hypothetical protein ACJASQ_001268 [Crocinitomicaceae bacterium]|jgi:hypothetical protein
MNDIEDFCPSDKQDWRDRRIFRTEYYTPKISLEEAFYMKHAFELLEIKSK